MEAGQKIEARLRGPEGIESRTSVDFIAGCDGAHSKVREVMGTGFPGGAYAQVFYVADVEGDGPAFNGDLNVELDESDFLAVFPLADKDRIRLIGAIRPGEGKDLDKLTFDDIKDRAAHSLRLKVNKVNWFSVYHISHRVTEHFGKGRAFLLGDAAHIHTPVGGQGMNTGIGDAINLAWKLKAVLAGQAMNSLLDTYEAERRAFALRLVHTTDMAFNFVASDGHLAEIVRTRLVPIVLPQLVKLDVVREYIFRTLSQICVELPRQRFGPGAMLAPSVVVSACRGLNRAMSTITLRWSRSVGKFMFTGKQRRIYGNGVEAGMSRFHVFQWSVDCGTIGLAKDALYLIRPDTYVGLANADQNISAVERFLEKIRDSAFDGNVLEL